MICIHKEVFGEGPPLVMLHGWAMHTGIWRDFARQLAAHRQVICLDLPGHGRSSAFEPYTLEAVATALLDAIPVREFILLGWSLGATVAMEMADRCPERVQKLLVLAGNPCFVENEAWPGVGMQTLDGFAELLQRDVQQTLTRFLALQVNGLSHGRGLLQVLKTALAECPPPSPMILQAGLDILKYSDMREAIRRSLLPVTVVLGDRDRLIPASSRESFQRLNGNVAVHVLENAGHAPFLSHPGQLIDIVGGLS